MKQLLASESSKLSWTLGYLVACLFYKGQAIAVEKPNILFILADDLGWADFSRSMDPLYPSAKCEYFETPILNGFLQSGLRFTDAYAPAPICTPTRRSIQFGMTPARQHGTEFIGRFSSKGHKSIAQQIKEIDPAYRCAIFGKWGEAMSGTWKDNAEINPEALGYNESDGALTGNATGTFYFGKLGTEASNRNYHCEADPDPKRTFSVTKRAITFLKKQKERDEPFFLQVNYYAIHTAHQALQKTIDKYKSKEGPSRQVLKGVGPMLEDLDTGIGELLNAIDELGLRENTYIFFSSDNGGERAWIPLPNGSEMLPSRNAPLRAVKGYLYEGGIRVPLAVQGPGVPANSICREPVALYDLLPTFCNLVGGTGPLGKEIDGTSLEPLLRDPKDGVIRRAVPGLFFHRPLWERQSHSAFRLGDYKLVLTWSGPWQIEKSELFNLAEDIGETRNLVDLNTEKAAAMTNALVSYLRTVDAEMRR